MMKRKKLFKEIYNKYDGKYGDLVQAHVDLLLAMEKLK